MNDTFELIYRRNLWNGVESLSGPGSGMAATTKMREDLALLVHELGVGSVVDVACGDGFWMPDLPGYLGIDVSPTAIRRAKRFHPRRSYAVMDGRMNVPRAGLVIVRDVIQHLSYADATSLLGAVLSSGSTWLLASTYRGGKNVDIISGDFYSPDLEADPFALPPPTRLIPDGYHYHESDGLRDPSKFLGLWHIG